VKLQRTLEYFYESFKYGRAIMKEKILLVNPPSSVAVYNKSKITAAVP